MDDRDLLMRHTVARLDWLEAATIAFAESVAVDPWVDARLRAKAGDFLAVLRAPASTTPLTPVEAKCARGCDEGWLPAIEGDDGSYVSSRPCSCEAGERVSRLTTCEQRDVDEAAGVNYKAGEY